MATRRSAAPVVTAPVGTRHIVPAPGTATDQGPSRAPAGAAVDPNSSLPPAQGAPLPPKGFVALTVIQARVLSKASAAQQRNVGLFIQELRAMEADGTYRTTFGPRVPDPGQLATALENAQAWTEESAGAHQWATYARTRKETMWDTALSVVTSFQTEFTSATQNDAALAVRMAGASGFFGVRSDAARRGAVTRAAKKGTPKRTSRKLQVPTPGPGNPTASPQDRAAYQGPAPGAGSGTGNGTGTGSHG